MGGITMTRLASPTPLKTALLAVLTLLGTTPSPASAESPVKMKKFIGAIDLTTGGVTPFILTGTATHLGEFRAYGEVEFLPDEEEGSLVGLGVVLFEAANGDLLVGNVAWEVEAGGDFRMSRIHFSWRDFIQFDDGTVVTNTGRFVDDRPPGLVVIAIISILAAILFPVFAKL
jgi:hypothetical protein